MCPPILIVDDSKTVRLLVHRALRQLGCELVNAETGRDGIFLAARFLPRVILLDSLMPGLDGFETLRRLRAEVTLADTQVVMLTANSTPETEARCLAAGAVSCLRKPLREEHVRAEVRRLLVSAAARNDSSLLPLGRKYT